MSISLLANPDPHCRHLAQVVKNGVWDPLYSFYYRVPDILHAFDNFVPSILQAPPPGTISTEFWLLSSEFWLLSSEFLLSPANFGFEPEHAITQDSNTLDEILYDDRGQAYPHISQDLVCGGDFSNRDGAYPYREIK